MTPLRVGMLGCGNIATRHAGAIAAIPDIMELVACCGRDHVRTDAFATLHRAATFVDLDRMLDEAKLDLVVATLPPFSRAGEIERIAARGVNLLVEKPIALDLVSADAMVAGVAASGVIAAIGFMYRFGDAITRWDESDAGRVAMYSGSYHCNALHADWWRSKSLSGGQIVEQVIHQIDLVRHFMGEPDRVYARSANMFHQKTAGYDVEDISAIIFGWDDGRIATLNASNIAVPGIWHKDWALFAERMNGRFSGWNDAVFTRTEGEPASETIAGTTDPFIVQLVDVATAIIERRPPRIPLAEGAATLRLALAARRSAEEGRELILNHES